MRFRAFSIDIDGNNLPCGSVARNFDFVIKLFKRGQKKSTYVNGIVAILQMVKDNRLQ